MKKIERIQRNAAAEVLATQAGVKWACANEARGQGLLDLATKLNDEGNALWNKSLGVRSGENYPGYDWSH